ncbi:MAG: hypothetical protein I8H75_01190 [Myxococcaceae bacterium]|nr:hypothetical protein [Myxococcaceae bacterium]MBH2005956.1 hypothetical protein [Myxococcaceae bacterium]
MILSVLALSLSLVSEARLEEAEFRRRTQTAIQALQHRIRDAAHNIESLPFAVAERIQKNLKLFEQHAQAISSDTQAGWSFRTHKLIVILHHAKSFFNRFGSQLTVGELPEFMRNAWEKPRWMDASNLDDLAMKASLVLILKTLNQTLDVHDSPFYHSTPMPFEWLSTLHESDFIEQNEFRFVHGGYAFGGQRQDTRFFKNGPFGKRWGPQDCSSWISKLIGAQRPYSTEDFENYWHIPNLKRLLKPINVFKLSDARPGILWLSRSPSGGHVNLVVDTDPAQGCLTVLEYARNLPHYEGFGYRNISRLSPGPDQRYYWFEIIESAENQEL